MHQPAVKYAVPVAIAVNLCALFDDSERMPALVAEIEIFSHTPDVNGPGCAWRQSADCVTKTIPALAVLDLSSGLAVADGVAEAVDHASELLIRGQAGRDLFM